MRLSPRIFVLAPVLAAAAALTAHSASAEVFHVPFAFTAGNQALPAGEYRVTHDGLMNSVTLISTDNKNIAQWVLGPGETPDVNAALMRFDATSDGYALRSIQYHRGVTARLDGHNRNSDDRRVHVIRGE